jgi:peptidyl-tRNA hydrolase ICT1
MYSRAIHFRDVSALLPTSHLRHSHNNNYLPNVPPLTKLRSLEHMAEARIWVEKFKQIPTLKGAGDVDMSFSKTSGSGGLD